MANAIASLKSEAPGKIPDKREPSTGGKWVFCALASQVLISAVQAQATAPAWTDLGVSWQPDFTWGDRLDISRTRMAADDMGNLFVSNGDSLTVGSASGAIWKTQPIHSKIANWYHTSVVSGPGGNVLWGAWSSTDRGTTWNITPDSADIIYSTAAAVSPAGYCLFGSGTDRLDRSAGPGGKTVRVHYGNSFGNIVDIVISSSGKAYAASGYDDLLVSRDSGFTWTELPAVLKSDPAAPKGVHPAAAGLLALEPAYPEACLWSTGDRKQGVKTQVTEYAWSGDSLVARRHANLNAPDSTITGFRVQKPANGPAVLWLGTWGQGVFRSRDRGETWEAFNLGLQDLRIESLVEGWEGRIFTLTPVGLFSLSDPSLGLDLSRAYRLRRSGNGTSAGNSGTFLLPGTDDGRRFRIDGRMRILPYPTATPAP